MSSRPATKDITLHYISDELLSGNNDGIEVAVTLPTFRRPDHVVKTLKSIANQRTSRNFICIVMENDPDNGEGARAAESFFRQCELRGIVINAHRRGNCSAYNAGWYTALSNYRKLRSIMVIDDDEVADPLWIEKMTDAALALDVDIVGGPQIPLFEENAEPRYASHPVFQPAHSQSGKVDIIYSTGNVLISAKVLRHMGYPYLDEKFNFLGGGDADFYARSRQEGFTFGWENNAPVTETIPARRTETSWLNARGLRNGAISTLIEKRAAKGLADRVKIILKSLALLAASPFRSFALFVKTGSPIIGIYHINVALGRLAVEFGFANEQYREPEKN